jgi:tetratricopeptide (TPR) repeat protein
MKFFLPLLALFLAAGLFTCSEKVQADHRLHESLDELAKAKEPLQRFYALGDAAKESFNTGKIEDARKYADELLKVTPAYKGDWNYGNAVQDANLVLGRIAVTEGRLNDAEQYLLEAGASPGSPQMDSFGPNMSLAKDLLEKGRKDAVLKYFDLCKKFWSSHPDKLDDWSKEVRDGGVPDFGANLVY